jgi:hypothetical protein
VPEKTYNNTVEFRVSNELYNIVHRLTDEHHLTRKEFVIASVGLLNDAHEQEFSTLRTQLKAAAGQLVDLPSIRTPRSEFHWPRIIRTSLAPHLYDPLAEYAGESLFRLQDRGRQAFRFGAFVLSHVSPLEGDPIEFWHDGEPTDIIFRTSQ